MGSALNGNSLLHFAANSFHKEMISIKKKGGNFENDRVSSPENVSIHLKDTFCVKWLKNIKSLF